MSVDLKSESGDEFGFSNAGWRAIAEMADSYGFDDSQCTEPEEGVIVVPAQSALNFAGIIEKALAGTNDTEIAAAISRRLTELLVQPSDSPLFPNDPVRFTEKGVSYWRDFVRFARRGGFTVYF